MDMMFGMILATEYCALQIRMIIETIALLCLVVHKDIIEPELSEFEEIWKAHIILNKIGKFHDNFFPIPVNQHVNSANPNITTGYTFDVDGAITKRKLISAYHKCGQILHMGGIKNFEDQNTFNYDVKFVSETISGIGSLLNHHRILLKNENKYLRCILASRQNGGVVSVHVIDGDVRSESPDERVSL